MKICVVIPAFNEERAVGPLVSEIRSRGLDVLVIDDGSTDSTALAASGAGATVISQKPNRGKGASLAAGFSYALEHAYEAVITVDGDGQHHPEDITQFLTVAAKGYAIVVGNRLNNPRSMPLTRLLTNRFMSWIISGVTGQRIPDTQCGFRLITREVLESVRVETSKYEIESEMLIKGSRKGFKIASVPIKSIYLNEQSYINPMADTFRFVRYLWSELFTRRSKRGQ